MTVDLRKREFLAQPGALPIVRVAVDRPVEDERFLKAVELLLKRLRSLFDAFGALRDLGLPRAPGIQHGFAQHVHVAFGWLQPCELVDEQAFEVGFADVHDTAGRPAVVVRVVIGSAFRVAPREWTAARAAANEGAEWKLGTVPLPRPLDDSDTTAEHGLYAVEEFLAD